MRSRSLSSTATRRSSSGSRSWTSCSVARPWRRYASPTGTSPNPTWCSRQEAVLSIDPEHQRVITNAGTYEADILVVALGADLDLGATPGLTECGQEFYTPDGAAKVRELLPAFEGGNIVIGVLGGFFKCPPAPYETAIMLHDYLIRRGVRQAATIQVVTPMPKPVPISDEVSDAILSLLDEQDIGHSHSCWITHLDPAANVAHLKDGRELPFDMFMAVPIHVAPPVLIDSGLTEPDSWIAVDKATLATKFPDVHAAGDITSAPVPRAGVIAEGEASTIADLLVNRIKGNPPPAPSQARSPATSKWATTGSASSTSTSSPGRPPPRYSRRPPCRAPKPNAGSRRPAGNDGSITIGPR
jgi:sulfide:quinone oxidoreductase